MGNWIIVFILTLSIVSNSFANSRHYHYIVKKNDNASTILYKAGLKPIYSKLGSLVHLQKKNKKNIKNINKLRPGTLLYFPEKMVSYAKKQGVILITQNNEIRFIKKSHIETKRFLASEKKEEIGKDLDKEINDKSLLNKDLVNSNSKNDKDTTLKKNYSGEVELPSNVDSELILSLGTGFTRLDSEINSSSAALLSKPTSNAKIKWQQNWSSVWQSFIRWQTESITYQETSQGSLVGDKQNISMMALGLNKEIATSLFGTLEIGTKETILATSKQTSIALLETRPSSYLNLSLTDNLLTVRNLKLNGSVGAGYLSGVSGSNFEVKPGIEYTLQIQVVHKLKNYSLFAAGEYVETSQKTSISSQINKEVRTNLGFSIPFGVID